MNPIAVTVLCVVVKTVLEEILKDDEKTKIKRNRRKSRK